MCFSINSVVRVELILALSVDIFLGKNYIEEKCKAIKIVKGAEDQANLIFWCNKSKLDQEWTVAAIV